MADNTRLNQETTTGDLIASDDISGGVADGAKAQRVKQGFGVDGEYTDVSLDSPLPSRIVGATSTDLVKVTNGSLDVSIQDQHTKPFDIFFSQVETSGSTLAIDATINGYSITLSGGHTVAPGDQLVLHDSQADRIYIGEVLSVAVGVAQLDTPLNFSYTAARTTVVTSTKDLNVNGSSARQTFSIAPPTDAQYIDITRINFKMITTNEPDLDAFGDIAGGLTRGLAVRLVNGENVNLFNLKTNGEFVNLMYDVTIYEVSRFGVLGLGGRLTYGGPSKHGVVLRLGPGDTLEAIVQDDLTDLVSFRMIASGHVVE